MLDIVWVVQLLGLAVSVLVTLGLVGVCHRLSDRSWPFVYLLFLYCSSSLLTWRALVEAAWLSKAVLVVLLAAVGFGLPHVFRIFVSLWRNRLRADFGALDRWCQAAVFLMAAAVLTDVLYAAFPGYRYDQLNYHLVTPKLVDVYGVLPPFISSTCLPFLPAAHEDSM
ncbi:MAG: hypothetical protein RI953_1336 [Pseudomonadota bacterium]|jgi:hypothetical protein